LAAKNKTAKHTAASTSRQQYAPAKNPSSVAPKGGPKKAPARYRCDYTKSFGDDKQAKSELKQHLKKHKTHRRGN